MILILPHRDYYAYLLVLVNEDELFFDELFFGNNAIWLVGKLTPAIFFLPGNDRSQAQHAPFLEK